MLQIVTRNLWENMSTKKENTVVIRIPKKTREFFEGLTELNASANMTLMVDLLYSRRKIISKMIADEIERKIEIVSQLQNKEENFSIEDINLVNLHELSTEILNQYCNQLQIPNEVIESKGMINAIKEKIAPVEPDKPIPIPPWLK